MNKQELVEKLRVYWTDWDDDGYNDVAETALNLLGLDFFNRFDKLYPQEKDTVISVLQAIRGY